MARHLRQEADKAGVELAEVGNGVDYYFAKQFRNAGVPDWIGKSIEIAEGDHPPTYAWWDTDAYSVGPLAIHTVTGQGAGYTVAQLEENPNLQAQLGIPHIAAAYRTGVASGRQGIDLLDWVAAYSGHPTETGTLPSDAATNLQNAYNTVTGGKGVTPASTTNGTNYEIHNPNAPYEAPPLVLAQPPGANGQTVSNAAAGNPPPPPTPAPTSGDIFDQITKLENGTGIGGTVTKVAVMLGFVVLGLIFVILGGVSIIEQPAVNLAGKVIGAVT